jgi:hypothetical protein
MRRVLLVRELPHQEREQPGDTREREHLRGELEPPGHDFMAALT